MKGEGGFVLVITLIITALLVALTAEFVNEVFVDTSSRHNYIAAQQAGLLAESGVAGGRKIIQMSRSGQAYSSLGDRWAAPLQVEDDRGNLDIVIEEESGKLNLNYLVMPDGSLNPMLYPAATRLFKQLKLPADLLASLTDWIDSNEEARPSGAETTFYRSQKPAFSAKNGRLDTLEELQLVRGFNNKTIEVLKPHVTIYPDDTGSPVAEVNINTASREVLIALDEQMTESLAENVLNHRKATPFKDKAAVAQVPGMATIATRLSTNIRVIGNVYRIRSMARVNEASRVIEAVVRVGSPQYLYWREY